MKGAKGRCACGAVAYQLEGPPLVVHACHCRDCQRITGSAFVVNLWIERALVRQAGAAPASHRLAGGSGSPHELFFCACCGTYVWSRYERVAADTLFVRAGTLDDPGTAAPDVHIFTRSKVPWLELPPGARAFRAGYRISEVWPEESKERLRRCPERAGGGAAPGA